MEGGLRLTEYVLSSQGVIHIFKFLKAGKSRMWCGLPVEVPSRYYERIDHLGDHQGKKTRLCRECLHQKRTQDPPTDPLSPPPSTS